MIYRYGRDDIERVIEQLAISYPKSFFIDPEKRRPLKHNIGSDLIKDGVAQPTDLLSKAIDFYQSHFGYQYALEPGVKRIDLLGRETGTVTETEARNAKKYIHDRRQEERERQRAERVKHIENLKVEKITPVSNLPILKPPTFNTTKEIPMPKATKANDPLTQLSELSEAVRNMQTQPEPLRPFLIAGLRVVIAEIEKTITTMEDKHNG